MTQTWVVGVDGSENARHAATWALDQADGRDVRIVLVASWSVPVTAGGFGAGVVWPDWSDIETGLQQSTEALAAELARPGVTVEARTVQGPAARALVDVSREADLLVVGARGLGGAKGAMLGSVSQRCVSHCVVPTAVITADAPVGPAQHVLIGFDGSANARAAASWGLAFATPDATITVLDALALAPWLSPDMVRERFAGEVEAAESEFQAQMGELDPDGRATHTFVLADARAALAEASEQADLVVLGARGRSRLRAALLGSTTTWMLGGATRATVVVPAPAAP